MKFPGTLRKFPDEQAESDLRKSVQLWQLVLKMGPVCPICASPLRPGYYPEPFNELP